MQNGIQVLFFTFIVSIALNSIAVAGFTDGLLGYWNFDETDGTTAADSSGNGNDAILEGNGVTWKPNDGKFDGAVEFDGSGDAVEDDNGADYINGLIAITVSVWVKSAETHSDRGFIDGRDPGGDDTVLSLRYDAAGHEAGGNNLVKAGITTTGGIQRLESSSNVQTLTWQHFALTWSSGNELALYIFTIITTNDYSLTLLIIPQFSPQPFQFHFQFRNNLRISRICINVMHLMRVLLQIKQFPFRRC